MTNKERLMFKALQSIYIAVEQDVADDVKAKVLAAYEECRAKVIPPDYDFKEQREIAKLTLRQVEEMTGISNAYLCQLEKGKITNPSFNVVLKLHTFYTLHNNKTS